MISQILNLLSTLISKFTGYADDSCWKDRRFYYDGSGNLIYKAFNTRHKAATSRDDWYVWKYTWTDGNIARTEGPLIGVCDDRASMAWGA